MAEAWPWLAVAGLGALHGLNPAAGWMFAAARGLRAGDAAEARRALRPVALGHAASIAAVVAAVSVGLPPPDPAWAARLTGLALMGAALGCGAAHGHARLAVWSFLMSAAHGAGLMLVPAFMPLCLSGTPAREIVAAGALGPALAVVGVHMAAMLLAAGTMALGVCRGMACLLGHGNRIGLFGPWKSGPAAGLGRIGRPGLWRAGLAVVGAGLLAAA